MKRAYINGKIYTSNPRKPFIYGFIVNDGYITEVIEEDKPIRDIADVVDLNGKCVIPGIIDAHMHGLMLAEYSKKISCLPPKINSIEELKDEIKRIKDAGEYKGWIEGWGYDEGKLKEKRSPNRYDLDEASGDVPVSIVRTCGHIRCVNSKALELAGITKDTLDPQGGHIEKDENGEPTGVLQENARNLVTPFIPEASYEELVDSIVDLGELLLSKGIVAFTDMGALTREDIYDYFEKAKEKGLKQEVALYYFWEFCRENKEAAPRKERYSRDNQIRVAGVKIIGDGSFSGHTAWVDEPYLGTDDDFGISVCSDELLESAIEFCKENHCQLSAHAMGGRAIDRMVSRVYEEEPWMEEDIPYTRVEHVTEPREDSIRKGREKGIAFVTQPIFQYAEIESYLVNLGLERTKKAYPIKHMLEEGVNLSFSTDAPATSWAVPYDPFPNLKAAVTRVAYDGTDYGKEQAVDIETAIRLYTRESAKAAGFKDLGELSKGFKADFAVLDKDIFAIDEMDIDKVSVEKTYINGELVYKK